MENPEQTGKQKKVCRSLSSLTKTFAWNWRNDSNNSICKSKEESPSNNDIPNRNRAQGIFRSIKKKIKQNKLYTCKSKQKVNTIEQSNMCNLAFVSQSAPDVDADKGTPPVPPPRRMISDELEIEASPSLVCKSIGKEHFNLAKYGWFWGPITKQEAEHRLCTEPDGSFLVRDSSSDRHVFTLSFRSYGQTMHSHIEYNRGVYSMGEQLFRSSVAELIEGAIAVSKDQVFSYSKSRNPADPAYPVRLTKPISRLTEVRSLKYLCRFVIRQYINVNNIQKLPLPNALKIYLQQGQY